MKTLKLTLMIVAIIFFAVTGRIYSQTYHAEYHSVLDGVIGTCIERPISGEYTYQINYHLDPKSGAVDNVHWNVLHANVYDTETGEKLVLIETGHDIIGVNWDFWNWASGGVMPTPFQWQGEGVVVEATFKFIAKGGEKFGFTERIIVHRNAADEITVWKYSWKDNCNW